MAVPVMRVACARGEKRPNFNQQEIDYLLGFMADWVAREKSGRTRRFYEMKMAVLALCGILSVRGH